MTARRRTAAGALLAAMLAASVGHGVGAPVPAWIAGLAAWIAAALLWADLGAGQRRQCAALAGVGLAGLGFGLGAGSDVDPARVLDENQGILALIAGVSFVRLAAPAAGERDPGAPRGAGALLRTLLGLNVLGAAINITALLVVGDRIARERRIGVLEGVALSRAFSLAVLYSPFIAGMALALNQAPQARLAPVAATGALLAALGIGFTWAAARRRDPEAVAAFAGFPLRAESLWMPGTLAAAVIACRLALPHIGVITAVALLAPLVAAAAAAARLGPARAGAAIAGHVAGALPRMSGELALFLAAGVLAVGLAGAFDAAGVALPADRFGGALASGALLAVVLAAAAGLHPIVSLTVLVPLLEPLAPPPEAIVVLFVSGWSIGCTMCPFSGTNLLLHARYGVPVWRFPAGSAGYAAFMWAAASAALMVASAGA